MWRLFLCAMLIFREKKVEEEKRPKTTEKTNFNSNNNNFCRHIMNIVTCERSVSKVSTCVL